MGRLSQALAEGDGISILAEVSDHAGAAAAEEQGAEGLALRQPWNGDHAGGLPLLWLGPPATGYDARADAVVIDLDEAGDQLVETIAEAGARGLETVLRVRDHDDLERVLVELDPEIVLLSTDRLERGRGHLEGLLELLADLPAGKLAIADLAGASAADVAELERAGMDAVLVTARDVGTLVGDAPPEV